MKQLLALIAITSLFTGCAGFERPASNTDFGAYPKHYQQTIPQHMARVLKDPESARYRFDLPQKAYTNQGLAYGGKVAWQGYVVDFYVNAKNSFGGYTGEHPYTAMIRDDAVSQVVDQEEGHPFLLLHRY